MLAQVDFFILAMMLPVNTAIAKSMKDFGSNASFISSALFVFLEALLILSEIHSSRFQVVTSFHLIYKCCCLYDLTTHELTSFFHQSALSSFQSPYFIAPT